MLNSIFAFKRNTAGKRITMLSLLGSIVFHIFLGVMVRNCLNRNNSRMNMLDYIIVQLQASGEDKKISDFKRVKKNKGRIVRDSSSHKKIEIWQAQQSEREKHKPKKEQSLYSEQGNKKKLILTYQDIVKQKIERAKRYPPWAKEQKIEGMVNVSFEITPNGISRNIKIIQSSGYKILDEEARQTIVRANPFPPLPQELRRSALPMQVAIIFKLR